MKRKIDMVDEEHGNEDEENESSSDESDDEEPRIKNVLSHLSQAVSVKRASELLHSMAASKDLLFWTPCGQLLRNKRIIPVTNIAELLEYVLLPHNDDVTKPRALNTFLDGLAELGIDKGLIKNKKLLSDLIEKEKDYRNNESTFEKESNVESASDREEDGEDIDFVNGNEDEDTQERDNDTENDSEETEISSPETSTTIHSENLCEHCENSNVYGTLIMKCPKCFWHDYYKICPICDHQIPEERNYIKEGFLRCHDCGAITHKNAKTLETNFYSPSKQENEEDD